MIPTRIKRNKNVCDAAYNLELTVLLCTFEANDCHFCVHFILSQNFIFSILIIHLNLDSIKF